MDFSDFLNSTIDPVYVRPARMSVSAFGLCVVGATSLSAEPNVGVELGLPLNPALVSELKPPLRRHSKDGITALTFSG